MAESPFQFSLGTEATTANHRFIYDDNTGQLLFDRDGIGGAGSQILATFTVSPVITPENIRVI